MLPPSLSHQHTGNYLYLHPKQPLWTFYWGLHCSPLMASHCLWFSQACCWHLGQLLPFPYRDSPVSLLASSLCSRWLPLPPLAPYALLLTFHLAADSKSLEKASYQHPSCQQAVLCPNRMEAIRGLLLPASGILSPCCAISQILPCKAPISDKLSHFLSISIPVS